MTQHMKAFTFEMEGCRLAFFEYPVNDVGRGWVGWTHPFPRTPVEEQRVRVNPTPMFYKLDVRGWKLSGVPRELQQRRSDIQWILDTTRHIAPEVLELTLKDYDFDAVGEAGVPEVLSRLRWPNDFGIELMFAHRVDGTDPETALAPLYWIGVRGALVRIAIHFDLEVGVGIQGLNQVDNDGEKFVFDIDGGWDEESQLIADQYLHPGSTRILELNNVRIRWNEERIRRRARTRRR
jgi:hypothetical protein